MLIFDQAHVLAVNQTVIEKAIEFRRMRKMSLGDAIIAATAYLNNLELLTRNTNDFSHIPGLHLVNPFKS